MAKDLDALLAATGDPKRALQAYPGLFRRSLEADDRMCLCGFMAAEYDDLPDAVKAEVQTFADVSIAWLARMVSSASVHKQQSTSETRARIARVRSAQTSG